MKLLKHPFPWLLMLLLGGLYFLLPILSDWVVSHPTYAKYAGKDAVRITNYLQSGFLFPFQSWIKATARNWVVLPYLLLVGFGLLGLYRAFPRLWKGLAWAGIGLWCFLWLFPNSLLIFENKKASISEGTVANGALQHGKRLPFSGNNFTSYSFLGYLAGRTYVHEHVRATLLDAFALLQKTHPEITFVIGETGHPRGGHFPPHRTHRNGLSVDIMSPLLKNEQATRSHHLFNIWGYGLVFDNKGNSGNLAIDYATFAALLEAIQRVAPQNGLRIKKVIFDPVLRPYLLKTEAGQKIRQLPFTKNRVTVRHDDHVHIDFELL